MRFLLTDKMSFLKLKVFYKKYQNLKIVEKIKIDNDSKEFFYFKPSDQFLCCHPYLKYDGKDYQKFKTVDKILHYPSYLDYYDINSNQLKFNNELLLSEKDFVSNYKFENPAFDEILKSHLECNMCSSLSVFTPKIIRARKKLDDEEKFKLCHSLGLNYRSSTIENKFNISSRTLKKIKFKLRNNLPLKRKKRNSSLSSALSPLDQKNIIHLVTNHPDLYSNATKINRKLKLNCVNQTTLNFLKKKSI